MKAKLRATKKVAPLILIILIISVCVFHTCAKERHPGLTSNANTTYDWEKNLALEMELIAYGHSIYNFVPVSVNDVIMKIENNDTFALYIGRATCQWCRKLVPVLSKVVEDENLELFYLDSEDTQSNPQLAHFRNIYQIETVPAIILFDQEGHRLLDLNIVETSSDDLKKQLNSELH